MDRRIEQVFGGVDRVGRQTGAVVDLPAIHRVAKEGEAQKAIGDLDRVIPVDHLGVGGVGGEPGEQGVAVSAGGGGRKLAYGAGGFGAHP